jgi:flavin reductase (DIM6/NTAB) family NADH-FMN oxidoreductase RutF
MKEFDTDEADTSEGIRLVTTAVTPRPIAWIATRSEEGTDNLAPYSSYNHVSSRQPAVQSPRRTRPTAG